MSRCLSPPTCGYDGGDVMAMVVMGHTSGPNWNLETLMVIFWPWLWRCEDGGDGDGDENQNTNPNDLPGVLISSVRANCGKLELETIDKVGQTARLYLYL